MKLMEWLLEHRPGVATELDDRFEIQHHSGEHSTLFKSQQLRKERTSLSGLDDIYTSFDGADLFSSTFKIAADSEPKYIGKVRLVDNLEQFQQWVDELKVSFPEKVTPFMYQSGIGVYAIGETSGKIYEWDDELEMLSDEFENIEDVFSEWLDAVS
ncbi:hypothetical protein MACH09_41080 [Vibrio sp. MACH09]|uniref:hypothetical protein n=1 Tax=Vibrio sp. MACH09 TaxID=3025122 RepID=UPI002792DD0F|nr:hypothetical protein [Vibrio sp. MACH09]GLO63600.1 hypothetical protein MACH09_41080 [Vibrio sp. MACH09]